MKKKILSLLACVLLLTALLPLTVQTAFAKDYDRILSYHVDVTPNVDDGSLAIRLSFRWKALEDLPASNSQQGGVKIGIPNGSIRDLTALSDNIDDISFDNSYVYVDFTRGFDAGEEFDFSFRWVQEYMYRLENGMVSYDYTPGWFDGIRVDEMTLTWHDPAGVTGNAAQGVSENGDHILTATDMDYGDKLSLSVTYADWPTALDESRSADNSPYDNNYGYDNDGDYCGSMIGYIVRIVILLVVLFVIMSVLTGASRYRAGFGNRYIFVNGLWYPRGPDGRPRPGSVGTKHRPAPPRNNNKPRGGGFGGGGRGGGFGGGGFGGGGHCACASSCACACACACAGGGRAGCSAKNLYGAIHLDGSATEKVQIGGL